ncbi:hypothetical protein BJ878DRAFT_239800 [Calycina marina]|uniref:Uncharacterized protein n=1 Tax=Calycina marina TaxID=1763456 RepID=A0A9P7YWG9_9HELO|nr:hypothetical protein BJ878DRAFT_239800 [Calycina marina]
MKNTMPFHHAATLSDVEYFDILQVPQSDDDDVTRVQLDGDFNNILHVTSGALKPISTKWILDYRDDTCIQAWARNRYGITPLEKL